MAQRYSNPKRANDPHSLPDVETFYMSQAEIDRVLRDNGVVNPDDVNEDNPYSGPGWYFWHCFPGCLPDSAPDGPYDTEALAIAAASDDDDDDDDTDPDDDDSDDDEPQAEDIVTSDHKRFYEHEGTGRKLFEVRGDGPYTVFAPQCRTLNAGPHATIELAIRAYLDATQFWPNVWFISDHGNPHRIAL